MEIIETDFAGVEKSYENYITAFFSGNAAVFFGFCSYVNDEKLVNKFTDQLTIEKSYL